MSDGPHGDPSDADDDVEKRLAQRRGERRRGTPPGREPLPGRTHTVRLLVVTVVLVLASAAVLTGVMLLAG